MSKFVARITVVSIEPGGKDSTVIYKAKTGKRKVSRWLRPLERLQGRSLEAQKAFSDELLDRHRRSSRRRRDGFLSDGLLNMFRAQRKALKRLRKSL